MKRAVLVTLAGGLAAMTLPASTAVASQATTADGAELGGFAARSIATPIRVEVYEPLIPIPAEPQAELDVAYTKAISASGPASKGRASWLWPGDPVGEGFKVFVEQLGLPEQLGERGYPVQVNSEYPSDNESTSDEPVPGMVMRTSSSSETTVAEAGFSTTGDLEDGDDKKGDKDKGGGDQPPGPPELPGLPGSPELPGPPDGDVAADEPAPAPLGALSALVTADAVNGVSKTTYGTDTIVSSAVTRIHGLSLLDGVITADTVRVLSRTTSTLTTSKNENDVTVEGLEVGGMPFGITKDGVVVSDSKQEIPGLPDEASAALAELGVSFTLPTATTSSDGGTGSQEVRGLQVAFDFAALRSRFDSGPVDGVIAQLPDDLGKLKAALGAVTKGQPNIVVVLGEALTEAATVAPIDFEPPTEDPAADPPTAGGGSGGTGGGTTGSGGTGSPTSSSPTTSAASAPDGTISGPVESTEVAVQPTASGLPPLGSVPGALLIGGLVLAGVLGWWFQKMGGLVLGGSASCAHGLSSGVPDLRKA
jgi:hypothetical protein